MFRVYALIIFDICLTHETITTIKIANISTNPKVSCAPLIPFSCPLTLSPGSQRLAFYY